MQYKRSFAQRKGSTADPFIVCETSCLPTVRSLSTYIFSLYAMLHYIATQPNAYEIMLTETKKNSADTAMNATTHKICSKMELIIY